MKKMKRALAAYYAGYFDGEGSIMIARQPRKRPDGTPYYTHELRLQIASTDPVVVTEFKEVFGGAIQYYAHSRGNAKCPVYQWAIWSLRAIEAIKTMYPYMRTKRSDADIAIAFQAIVGKRGHGVKLTTEVMAERETFRLKLIENHGTAARWASAKKSWDDRHPAAQAG